MPIQISGFTFTDGITINGSDPNAKPPEFTPLSYSVFLDGIGDYVAGTLAGNTTISMGTGDFTIEGWIYPTTSSGYRTIFGAYIGNTDSYALGLRPNNRLLWQSYSPGSPDVADLAVPINTWTHVAWVKSGTICFLFINGILKDTTTGVTNTMNGKSEPAVGATLYTAFDGDFFTGYISNLRTVKGLAVYTGNFVVPDGPLAATQSASSNINAITAAQPTFLTVQDQTLKDNGSTHLTMRANSQATISSFNPFNLIPGAYLAVAGGGAGAMTGGGGGAGGLLYRTNLILVSNVIYTITVGAGSATANRGSSFGSPSTITTNARNLANITATGGGAGQSRNAPFPVPGGDGGSGGGGGAGPGGGQAPAKTGILGQGFPGGAPGDESGGGGGGGARGAGIVGSPYGGNGGAGVYLTISGSNVAYAGGGGGGGVEGLDSGGGAGGIGGGGGGEHGQAGGGGFSGGTFSTTAAPGTYGPGAISTGGGGGGAAGPSFNPSGPGGKYLGGSGVVILTSNGYSASSVTGNPNVTYKNSVAIYRFWQSGTIRW